MDRHVGYIDILHVFKEKRKKQIINENIPVTAYINLSYFVGWFQSPPLEPACPSF